MACRMLLAPQPTRKPKYGESLVGKTLRSKWQIDELLGVGGTACVYAATHRNGLRAAVKRLHPDMCPREEVRARFVHEGYVANQVHHPGIVHVYDDDVDEEGVTFLVMELLRGSTVSALARKQTDRRLPALVVLGIARQALEVLEAAHARGVLHRDIKPENLFIDERGCLKLLDFGIARGDVATRAGAASGDAWTKTGLVMGTPGFIAPEQAIGDWKAVDARSDVWALGATMFTLLTGRHVHEAETVNQVLFASMTRPPPSVGSVRHDLDPEVVELVDRALAYKPAERWLSARAMLAAVRRAERRLEAARSVSVSFDDLDLRTGEETTLRWSRGAVMAEQPTELATPGVVAPKPSRSITRIRRRRGRMAWATGAALLAACLGALLYSRNLLAAELGRRAVLTEQADASLSERADFASIVLAPAVWPEPSALMRRSDGRPPSNPDVRSVTDWR